ncbi:MAG TPA: hypothetical protein VLK25_13820 [Allosphingosinicella sp.]|nr:hypothetical protein [Allosphingosinicella sp.]
MHRKIIAFLAAGAALLSVAQASAQRGAYSGGQFEDETLPPDFRGRITYEGSYTAELVRPRARNAPQSRNGGAITFDVSFDGNRISGSFTGVGGIGQGSFTGTRNGADCTIIEPTGARNTVRCDRNFWGGENHTAPGAPQAAVVRIQARATKPSSAAAEALGQESSQRVSGGQQSSPTQVVNVRRGQNLVDPRMARCRDIGFSAPTSQADLDRLQVIDLLNRGYVMANRPDTYCSSLFYGAAALRGDVQGMAGYSSFFRAESINPDRESQIYWCQRAYQGARTSGRTWERDAVNYFCPIETFAALMTPAERRANQVSVERMERLSSERRAEIEARGRAVWESLMVSSSSSGNRTCRSGYGTGTPGTEQPC